MPYNYDYFISYSHADNQSEDGKSGFVDEFVEKLQNSTEHQQMFGGKINVFFDKTEIHGMSDWDNIIRSNLASSRFLIVLLSPGYFKSEYCAREFDWWMQHEMHRCVLGEGTAPMLIVDVAKIYDYQAETIPSIPEELQTRFPNWLSQIRKIQSGPKFDIHNLDRAKIGDVLDSLREEVQDRVRRQEAAEKSPHTGQYPAYNENFVGRRENLRSLRKSLSEKAAAPYCALTGLGGFGKTELALTYGHAFAWDYGLGRVFAKCENKTSISETILTSGIAEMHGWELPNGSEDQQITFLFNHLNEKRNEIVKRNADAGNRKTLGAHILLILDNVNNRKLISKNNLAILPDYFHVIITTRENTNDISYIHTESVERLSEDESVELLCNLHPFTNPDEAKAARDIAKLLAGFTLSVELTGANLENNKYITYQKQYDQLVSNHAETFQKMADKTGDLTRHAAETVAAVLESTLSVLPDNARNALEFASVMVHDTVALGWLPELCGLDEDEGGEAIAYLTGYSLLTPLESESNIARIHRLVAETVKQKIPKEVQKEIIAKIRNKCEALLKKDKTFWYTSENSWNITPVSEFCLALANQWTIESSEQEIDWNLTWALDISGKILKSLGKLNEARNAFHQCYKIREKRVKTFPENADAQRDLSVSYMKIGNLEKAAGNAAAARELYEKALEISQRQADLMPNNVDAQRGLGISYERLGDLENAAGNTAAARAWYEKSLEIFKRLSDLMPNNVKAQKDLSVSYERLGDMEKAAGNAAAARDGYEKSLEIRKKSADLMPDNVDAQKDLSVSYERLGDLENAIGNAAAARVLYEQKKIIDQKLVDLMPDNVNAQRNLIISYERLGDVEKAAGCTDASRKWYGEALVIAKRLAEKMNNDITAQCDVGEICNDLAYLEIDANNAEQAKEWSTKSLRILEPLVDKAPNEVETQKILGEVYRCLGDSEKAIGKIHVAREWYKKALELFQRLVDKSPDYVELQKDLAETQEKLAQVQKQPWYSKLLKRFNILFRKD